MICKSKDKRSAWLLPIHNRKLRWHQFPKPLLSFTEVSRISPWRSTLVPLVSEPASRFSFFLARPSWACSQSQVWSRGHNESLGLTVSAVPSVLAQLCSIFNLLVNPFLPLPTRTISITIYATLRWVIWLRMINGRGGFFDGTKKSPPLDWRGTRWYSNDRSQAQDALTGAICVCPSPVLLSKTWNSFCQ